MICSQSDIGPRCKAARAPARMLNCCNVRQRSCRRTGVQCGGLFVAGHAGEQGVSWLSLPEVIGQAAAAPSGEYPEQLPPSTAASAWAARTYSCCQTSGCQDPAIQASTKLTRNKHIMNACEQTAALLHPMSLPLDAQ